LTTGTAFVLVLLLAGCGEPPSIPPSAVGPDTSARPGSPAKGQTIEHGSVAPEKGEGPPGPELSPEQRERLLRGTERSVDPRDGEGHPSGPRDQRRSQ
jgi:hypothetical protein